MEVWVGALENLALAHAIDNEGRERRGIRLGPREPERRATFDHAWGDDEHSQREWQAEERDQAWGKLAATGLITSSSSSKGASAPANESFSTSRFPRRRAWTPMVGCLRDGGSVMRWRYVVVLCTGRFVCELKESPRPWVWSLCPSMTFDRIYP